jgi:type IV secretion system protein VirB9
MIATDRRTYHLELTSLETSYMAALSWRYPADELAILTSRNQIARSRQAESISPNLNLSDLNFDYRIEGDRPDWRPVRVFDDGRRVFIQMPADLAMTEAPPLFVLGRKGNAELINYRIRGSYYIVDHLFEAAELRLGSAPQTVVRLRRGKGPAGLAALFGDRK